jgi:hypothetical protein
MVSLARNRIIAALAAFGTFSTLSATTTVRPAESGDGPPAPGEISLRLKGSQAKQISEILHVAIPAGGFPGEVTLRPSGCTDPEPGKSLHPSNVALDFKIKHPTPATAGQEFCVFSILTGEAGAGTGAVVPAKDVPQVEDTEPVYEVQVGYALVGGTWPAAKGRRSRGGASGTQFVLEIDAQGNERYYLLNTQGSHKVFIHADGATEVVLDNHNNYIELLSGETQPQSRTIASDTTGQRGEFWTMAAAAAKRCNLPGPDPIFSAALAEMTKDKVPGPPPVENQPGKEPIAPKQK